MAKPINVLFLCTHNSARSILAEAVLNALGKPRFQAYSAGSHPSGHVNPFAIEVLEANGYETRNLSSKSWDVFAGDGAPPLDVVITVCGDAADEVCPVWPGAPVHSHWGLPDPSRVPGDDNNRRQAFAQTLSSLTNRIETLVSAFHKKYGSRVQEDLLLEIHKQFAVPIFGRHES